MAENFYTVADSTVEESQFTQIGLSILLDRAFSCTVVRASCVAEMRMCDRD
jgi:hypothetical protein